MTVDPSWDVVPVVSPEVPQSRQRKLFRRAVLTDPVGLAEPVYQGRDREQIVVPSSLDQLSREELLRAQTAIATAVDGQAAIGTDADGAVPESMLLRHEWEIAVALRDISDLQAEHKLNAEVSAGPMTNAVLESQEDALARAHSAIAARVCELEGYADCVSAAEAAYRDWQNALRVSDLNDRYLELVARTAADEHAAAEISGMTERATTAQAFQQAVQQLSLTASALELP
jgi:hypothetical protein